MIATTELKMNIYDVLKVVGTTYEAGHVKKDAELPYIVYQLGSSIEGFNDHIEAVQYTLDIDAYDHRLDKNTSVVEALADSIDDAMNRLNVIGTNLYFTSVRESRTAYLPTDDEYTFRRNLRYTIKVFRKV